MIAHDESEMDQFDLHRMLGRGEFDDLVEMAKEAPGEVHLFTIAEGARQNQRCSVPRSSSLFGSAAHHDNNIVASRGLLLPGGRSVESAAAAVLVLEWGVEQ
jgi:hypothetical protein